MKKQPLHCNYAWGHLDFHSRGHYAPCFRYDVQAQPIRKLDEALPSEYMNSTEIQEVRRSLQLGEWPAGCRDCKNKEAKGVLSYRKESIDPDNYNWYGTPFDYSKTTIDRFHEIEMKFNRTCNFYCRHCDTQSNSRFELLGKKNTEIRDSLEKLDWRHLSEPKTPIGDVTEDILDDLIENIIPNTKRIMFGGGEPLFQIEHYRFLERLIEHPKINTKELVLDYNTNLSMITFKKYVLADLWNNFKDIRITISLDGTRKLYDYFRQNGNYDQTLEHIDTIVKECSSVKHISFVCTSTAYHAFYMDQILEDFASLKKELQRKYKIKISFKPTLVHHPEALDMVNLPNYVKQFLITRYKKTKLLIDCDEDTKEIYDRCMNEIINYLDNDIDKEVDFKKVAVLQDKLHNVDAFEYAPRVAEYVYNNRLIWN